MGSLNATGAGTAGAYPNDRGEQSSGVSWQRKRLHRADLSLPQLSDQTANNSRVRTDGDAPWPARVRATPARQFSNVDDRGFEVMNSKPLN
jgi:hypothetical protein